MTASPTPTDAGAGTPGELIEKSAKNPEKHHADPAYCSGADHSPDAGNMVGLPSDEEIARALAPRAWAECDATGVTATSTGKGATIGALSARARSLLDAASVAALIRPAFEAKERERGYWLSKHDDLAEEVQQLEEANRDLEAKLAQAVEALEPFTRFPVFVDANRWTDGAVIHACNGDTVLLELTLADLRRARSAARGETT